MLHTLESTDKLWIATASDDGSAHLVPFSFVWDGERVTMATRQDNLAARNVARTDKARLALGDFGDMVLIDGEAAIVPPAELDDALLDRLSLVSAIDGRRAPGFVYLQVTPSRIQTLWTLCELATPMIMRNGQWLG